MISDLLDMLPDYDDVAWQDLRGTSPFGDLDGIRCDIDFAKRKIRAEIESLKAENAALKADAERYRWMRSNWYLDPESCGDAFDLAIDAAMRDGKE